MCAVRLTAGEKMVFGQDDVAHVHAVSDPDNALPLHAGLRGGAAGNVQLCDSEEQSKHLPIASKAEKTGLQEPVSRVEKWGILRQLQHDVNGLQIML